MKRTYIQKLDNDIFYDANSMERFARKGMKQLRTELNLGIGVGMIMTIIGFGLFFKFSQIELLIIGALGAVPLFIILIQRPFKRYAALHKFQNKQIEL